MSLLEPEPLRPRRPLLRRVPIGRGVIFATPFLLLLSYVAAYWLGRVFPVTAASDERQHRYGTNNRALELVRVKNQRWLAGDRAILPGLDCVYHDSVNNSSEAWILYGF